MPISLKRFLKPLIKLAQSKKSVDIPSEIRECLPKGRCYPIQGYIQKLMNNNPDAPEFDLLLSEAERLNWEPLQLAKLKAYGSYYGGDLVKAFNYAQSYASGPNIDPDLFIIAAFSLYHLENFEGAYEILNRVKSQQALFDQRSDYYIGVALICLSVNQLDEVKLAIDTARRLAPDDTVIAFNAYAVYFELGDMERFEEVRQEILAGKHDADAAGFALGTIDLAQDRYLEGFRLWELRYKLGELDRYLNSALFDRPRWQGEVLNGKTLLVSVEQGFGDTVMMARYLHELLHSGINIVMEVQSEILSWLAYNFPQIEMVARAKGVLPALNFDIWIGAMSLPFALRSTSENIPGKKGYLKVPPDMLAYWQPRVLELASTGSALKIGLAWSGNPGHRADRRRSIPFLRMADAIRGIDAMFFALQTFVPAIHPDNMLNVSDEMVTLADTAALIACMDLIITVDTSIVHIAGALGKETWLLLPYRYEWRWGLHGEKNNWYDSVTVIRQPKWGDWGSVLDEVFGRRLPERLNQIVEAN